MAINLTTSEKNTFKRFLSLYLGSSFILILLISILYYQNERTVYFDLIKADMQNLSSKISSKIILSHMNKTSFDFNMLLDSKKYKISFYNKEKKKIYGDINYELDLSKDYIKHQGHFVLIDKSVSGHLNIYYIAIEENLYFKKIDNLKIDILFFFILIYSIIALISFYLSKLFLKPIKDERERLNTFIKDTTHELNTPISAILMSSESEVLTIKQIERIRLSAKRISEIYKDLTYTFLENNINNTIIEELDLKNEINEQLEYFEPLALKKKILIKCDIESFKFTINKDDFIRVFNNLISNAIKYNKVGGEIHIILKEKNLVVSDTGIGISNEKINNIFERYYRATSEQGGFGIGLNIVNRICRKYNINITVDSKIKNGTSFTLYFK